MLHLTRIILGSWLVAHKITLTATNHQGASLNPYLPPSRKRPQTSACTNFPLDTRLEVFSWTKSCFSHSHLVKQLVKQLHTLLTATELWSRTVSECFRGNHGHCVLINGPCRCSVEGLIKTNILDKHVPSLSNYMGSFIFPCHTVGGVISSCGILTFHVLHEQNRSSQLKTPGRKQESRLFQDNHQELSLMDLIDMISPIVDLCKTGRSFKILEITLLSLDNYPIHYCLGIC